MIRRPPRSTRVRSSAASDVYKRQAEGSRGVSGGPAQGGDVGATMETQCPVEDRSAEHVIGPFNATLIVPYPSELRDGQRRRPYAPLTVSLPETDRTD